MPRRNRKGRDVHGILLLDKPPGGSSNHALQRVKRLFGAKKAGHTGTLDPLATGMLPLCLGEATKLSAHLLDADKGYETTLRLGVTTDSADADGRVLEERAVPVDLDAGTFAAHCAAFEGPQDQVPPMVSAIKIDGRRLYALAREGVVIERAPRAVVIRELEVLAFDGETARLRVRCSKGTYIRSLVTDIGERIGCGAHVTALRRTSVAPFEGDGYPMVTLELLETLVADDALPEAAYAALDALLLPPDAGLEHLREVFVDAAGAARFRAGQDAPVVDAPSGFATPTDPSTATPDAAGDDPSRGTSTWRVREPSGRLLGLGTVRSVEREVGDDEASGPSGGGAERRVAPSRVLQWGAAVDAP